MDVRAENRGRPPQKVRFSAAPVTGRNFLTQGRPGVRVRNVRGKSGPKSLCLCCFFFPDNQELHNKRSSTNAAQIVILLTLQSSQSWKEHVLVLSLLSEKYM